MFSALAPGGSDLNFLDVASPTSMQSEREARAGKVFYNAGEFFLSRGKSETEFTPLEMVRYRASLLLGFLEHEKVEDTAIFAEKYTSRAFRSIRSETFGDLELSSFYQEILPSLEILCSASADSDPQNEAIIKSAREVRKSLEQLVQLERDLAGQFPNHIQHTSHEVHPGCYLSGMSLPKIQETRGDTTMSVSWADRARELSLTCKHDLLGLIRQADQSIAFMDKWYTETTIYR